MSNAVLTAEVGTRPLGNTGIALTPLGFGCAAAWGKALMGKPMITDEQAQALLERAYVLGIRYFDTGFNYGFAEERLGRILKSSEVLRREELVISTKFGERLVDGKWKMDFSPEWMEESLRISMDRLGVDYLDMFMCHGGSIDEMTPALLSALQGLKKKGLVRAVGINTFTDSVIEWVADTKAFDFVMLDYNILRQDREPMIRRLHDNGIGVIAGAPLAESLYSNRIFRIREPKDAWYLARALVRFRGQLLKGRRFRFVNDVPGMTGSQAALRYVLDNPYVSAAVFGTTTMSHLEDNADAQNKTLPEEIVRRIQSTR